MVSHYLFDAQFCNLAAGWEKWQIEKNVQDARHRIWHQLPAFASLTALNDWLVQRCLALWEEVHHPEQSERTIAQVFLDEQAQLMPLPCPFDDYVEHTKRVSPTCLVTFERHRYSVPACYANRAISLHVYAACAFVERLNKADFLDDKRTQQAVIMSLIIIGEAATKVMDSYAEFTQAHTEVPWRSMRGMRNRIAHGYFDINLDVVWETVMTALPELLKKLPVVYHDADNENHNDDEIKP